MRSGGINGVIRQDGVLRLPDGRQLGYAEYGHPEGELILGFHGVPGTRLMYRPMAAEALRLGLRLVAPDRPGFGLSPPKAGRGLADWLDDVGQLVRHLDARRFSLIGISGGAPFAVATAAHFGERVAALGLIGPIGPVAELGDDIEINPLQKRLFLRFPHRPRLFQWSTAAANGLFRLAPGPNYDLFVRALPPADREIMREKALRAHVIEDVHESLKWKGDGARADLLIFSQPWKVDYGAISARSILWQGTADTIVPPAAALALGRMIPGCRIIELLDEGHFWVYRSAEEILTRIASLAARR